MEEERGPKKFALAVDSENKATEFRLLSLAAPHMLSFHLSWFSFFTCFVSTFAAPPLLPVIRDNLNLTATDIGNAGIASVSGAILARLCMGTACDLVGPRLASASLILATTPAVYCTSVVDSPTSYLLARFFTGFSLASFVSAQFWMSSMFSSTNVGTANGLAGGWGNLGGGATQLLMPLLFDLIRKIGPTTKFTAWRVAFFIPGIMQTVGAIAVLALGQDMPDGNYRKLEKAGEKHKDNFANVFSTGVKNYRGWILAVTYGYCFGVELTIDNIIAEYFFDRFDLNLRTAGTIAASFGLANIVARPGGGWFSDAVSRRFGMRGRLWALWLTQSIGGVLCVLLGRMGSLGVSVLVMLLFSFFVQAACGLTFGVVPFVSRRALGLISGMTGGGGNVGAVLTQLIFFKGSRYSKETGITLMGLMILCCTLLVMLIYFPQWGGMFCGPEPDETEEAYYASEWSLKERDQGYHMRSLKFAENSRGERGNKTGDFSPTVTSANGMKLKNLLKCLWLHSKNKKQHNHITSKSSVTNFHNFPTNMSYSNQQATPMVVYPDSISSRPSSYSKGSFVPVFVVLAIVATLTAFACLVGQICARHYLRPRPRRDHVPYEGGDHVEGGTQMKPKGQVKLDKAIHHGGGGEATPNVTG